MIFVFVWLTLLSVVVSRSIHVSANGTIAFFVAEAYSIICTYHIFFIHPSVDGRLGCVHVFAIVSSAAMHWDLLNEIIP